MTLALPDSLGEQLSHVLAEHGQLELWPEFSPNGVSWVESQVPVRPCAPNFTQLQPEFLPHGWADCPPIAVDGSGWPVDLDELRGQWIDTSSGEVVEDARAIVVESAVRITTAPPVVSGLQRGDPPQILQLTLALDGETFLPAGEVTVFAGTWEAASNPLLPRGKTVVCSLGPVPPLETHPSNGTGDDQHQPESGDNEEDDNEEGGGEEQEGAAEEDDRLPSWIPSGLVPCIRLCSSEGNVVWEGEASLDDETGRRRWEVADSVMEALFSSVRSENEEGEPAEAGAGEEVTPARGLIGLDVLVSLDGTVFFPCREGGARFFVYGA